MMLAPISGPAFFRVFLTVLFVGGWGLNIAGLVRTLMTSEEDFRRIGKTRGGQLALYIVGIVVYPMGAVVGWIWLFSAKKRFDALSRLSLPPQNIRPAPGWWLASDGRWYPPQGEQLPPPPPPSSAN